jgi:hypothetical protein
LRNADRAKNFSNGTRQRVLGTLIEMTNFFHPEAGFGDQEIRAWQHCGGQLLDHETHRFGGGVEPLVLGSRLAALLRLMNSSAEAP